MALNKIVTQFFTIGRIMRGHCTTQSGKHDPFVVLRLAALDFIAEKEPTMKELADFLAISAPSATSIVNLFSKTSAVKRKIDSRDRRIVRLTITPKGRILMVKEGAKIAKHLQQVISCLDLAEQKNLEKILTKIITNYQTN